MKREWNFLGKTFNEKYVYECLNTGKVKVIKGFTKSRKFETKMIKSNKIIKCYHYEN